MIYAELLYAELREKVRELIEAHDDWVVNSYPSDGASANAARAWYDEAQRVENAVEALRVALAENGRCGRVMVGYGGEGSHLPTCRLPAGHEGRCSTK